MILRRVMKHVEDQNWFAVGIDFVIVVAGTQLPQEKALAERAIARIDAEPGD
ncbi:hypothetical protein BH23GEM3_BH23GEM3_02670 [soil metagenome]